MTDQYYKRTQTEKHFINEHKVTVVASADNVLPLAQRYKSVLVDARCIGNSKISFDEVGQCVLEPDSLAGACFPDLYESLRIFPLDKKIRLQMNDGVPCLMPHVANRFLSEKLTGFELTGNHHCSYKFYQYLPIHVVRKAARTASADIAFVQLQGDCSTLDVYLAKGADLVLNPTPLFQRLIEKYPWETCDESVGPWCYQQRAVLMQHDIVEGKHICNHIVDCYLKGINDIEDVKNAIEKSKDLGKTFEEYKSTCDSIEDVQKDIEKSKDFEKQFAEYKSACDSPEAWKVRNELVTLFGIDAVERFDKDNSIVVTYKRQRV